MSELAVWKNEKGEKIVVRVLGPSRWGQGYVQVQKATASGMQGVFAVALSTLEHA